MFIFFVHINIHVKTWAILKAIRQISCKHLFRLTSPVVYFHQHVLERTALAFFFLWKHLCAALFTSYALIITSSRKKHTVVSKENKRHDLDLNLRKLNKTLRQITCLCRHFEAKKPIFAHIWRCLLSAQNEAISLVAMRTKELWMVQENHATVKLDLNRFSWKLTAKAESAASNQFI